MNFLSEPKPVEVPGRVFSAVSTILFVWNLVTNGSKIDWIALVLFGCAFLPWVGYFVEYIKWGDIEARFPARSGNSEEPHQIVKTPANDFASLTANSKKILATLWKYQRIHGISWGFLVPPPNPLYVSFVAGVSELAAKGYIRIDPNGLVSLSEAGKTFCESQETQIATHTDLYMSFAPLKA